MNNISCQKFMKFVLRPLYFSLLIVCVPMMAFHTAFTLNFFLDYVFFASCWGYDATELICTMQYFDLFFFVWTMSISFLLVLIYLWCRKKGIRLSKFFDYLAKALIVFLGIYLLGLVHFIAKHGLT